MQRNRMTPPPRTYYRSARSRPWPRVSWWYSLLFAVPMLILLVMGIASLFGSDGPSKTIEIAVTDQVSGRPLQGAVVTIGAQRVDTNPEGVAVLKRPEGADFVIVQAVGYEPMHGVVNDAVGKKQSIALRSSTVSGSLVDGASGQPIAGANITVLENGEPIQLSATSAPDGAWSIANVPSGAYVRITANGYAAVEVPAAEAGQLSLTAAQPTEAASVPTETSEAAETEGDSAPSTVDRANLPEVPSMVRGIYVSANTAANPASLDSIIQLVQETELNAVVVDIKEDYVWYDTGVSFFRDAKAVNPIYDIEEVLAKLDAAGIYTIARLVVFKDPIVAENRPDLAIQDDNGGLWRGWQGEAWVNPFLEELWEANILLAVEAAQYGFDEIQYDYVRFPSDGPLATADFGRDSYTMDDRVTAIGGFLDESHERINAAGAWLAADVFGIVALYDDDQGIGQYLRDLVHHVDFVCPMVYPSHFGVGSIHVGEDGSGEPNDYPYEVIEISMWGAAEKMGGAVEKLRPWLQDFSLGGMSAYGPDQVRAQIDATEASGASGWMLWNSGGGTNNAAALRGP